MSATELVSGDQYVYGDYFKMDVKQLEDGVYTFIQTGEAGMVLPWRYRCGEIEVCLLSQKRADTFGKETLKVGGGYNGNLSRNKAAHKHLKNKLGIITQNEIIWWRRCLGVGPQYNFPIDYGFVLISEEDVLSDPTLKGCVAKWKLLSEACEMATAQETYFFDDLSATCLFIMLINHNKIEVMTKL